MATRLNPYIVFLSGAEDALEFYRSVLGGTVSLTRFREFGLEDTPDADKVMHGQVETPDGFTLMCGDTPTGMPHEYGTNVVVSLSGDAEDGPRLRGWFEALADGGRVVVPLEEQMWGDEFGQLVDRFGIVWVVDIGR